MERRAAVRVIERGWRAETRELAGFGRWRRRQIYSHPSAGEGHGGRDRGLRSEWRAVARRAGVPDSARGARVGSSVKREVSETYQGRGPAVQRLEREHESFGLEARPWRQGALVPFSVWSEIRDYTAFGGIEDPLSGICPDYRPGVVRRGHGHEGGSLHGRRPELEGSEASCARASQGAYPLYLRLGLGRTRGGDPVSLHRRGGRGSTVAGGVDEKLGHEPGGLEKRSTSPRHPFQCDSTLENRSRWEHL